MLLYDGFKMYNLLNEIRKEKRFNLFKNFKRALVPYMTSGEG